MRSVLCNLNIHQEAATITYEGNEACTAMANAQKQTPHTQHMDINCFALCDWVEQDLLILDWIDTKLIWTIPSPRHYNTPLKTNKKFYVQLLYQLMSTASRYHTFVNLTVYCLCVLFLLLANNRLYLIMSIASRYHTSRPCFPLLLSIQN
jgi:hypothetical protein